MLWARISGFEPCGAPGSQKGNSIAKVSIISVRRVQLNDVAGELCWTNDLFHVSPFRYTFQTENNYPISPNGWVPIDAVWDGLLAYTGLRDDVHDQLSRCAPHVNARHFILQVVNFADAASCSMEMDS